MQGQQEVNAWDILEGQKGGPLAWSWFGAVRHERKPSFYNEQHRQLIYHQHSKTPALPAYQTLEVNIKKENSGQDTRSSSFMSSDSHSAGHHLPEMMTQMSGLEAALGISLEQPQLGQSSRLPQTAATGFNQANTLVGSEYGGDLEQHLTASSQPSTSASDSLQQQTLFARYSQQAAAREKRHQDSLQMTGRSQFLLHGHTQQQVLLQPQQQQQQQQLASSSAGLLQAQQSQAHYAAMSRASVNSALYMDNPAMSGQQSGQLAQGGGLLVSPTAKHMERLQSMPSSHHLYLPQQQLPPQTHPQQYQQLYRRP